MCYFVNYTLVGFLLWACCITHLHKISLAYKNDHVFLTHRLVNCLPFGWSQRGFICLSWARLGHRLRTSLGLHFRIQIKEETASWNILLTRQTFQEYWLKLAPKALVWNWHILISTQDFISQRRCPLATPKVNGVRKHASPTGKQQRSQGVGKN